VIQREAAASADEYIKQKTGTDVAGTAVEGPQQQPLVGPLPPPGPPQELKIADVFKKVRARTPVPTDDEAKKMKELLDNCCVRLLWAGASAVPISFLKNPALIELIRAAIQVPPTTKFPIGNSKSSEYLSPADPRTQAAILNAQFANMTEAILCDMQEILKFAYVPTLVLGHDMTTLHHGAALAITLTGRDIEFYPFKKLVAIVEAKFSHTAIATAKAVTAAFSSHFAHHGRFAGGIGSDNASAAVLACYHLIDLAEEYDEAGGASSAIRDFWACIGHKLAMVLGYMGGKKDQANVSV